MRIMPAMLLFVFLLLVCASSSQAAVIYGGKLFHSQNFTTVVGGNFKIYGLGPSTLLNNKTGITETHYKKVVIQSDIDDTIELLNGTCGYTMMYKYCYKGSLVDLNNPLTFESSEIKSVMSISIESLPPSMTSITVKRNNKVTAFCGEWIPITINLTNGGTMLTNVTYSETLPENTLILETSAGSVDLNVITIEDRLMPNTTKSYTYKMINFDCLSKNWSAKYSFVALNGTIIYKNLTNLALIMNTSFKTNISLTPNKTNGARDEVNYTFMINNTHKSADLILDLTFTAPDMIVVSAPTTADVSNGYHYAGPLAVGNDLSIKLRYKATSYGNYTINAFGTITIGDYKHKYNSTTLLQVVPPNVIAYLDISNYTMNNSMTVKVMAKNDDIKDKYYYIYGFLRGFNGEEPLYYNNIDPDSTILIAKKEYNISGMGLQELQFEFDGVYRDVNGFEHELYDSKTVHINGTNFTVKAAPKTTVKKTTTTRNTTTTRRTAATKNTTTTSDGTGDDVEKKDFLTRIIEGLNNFFQSIFG